MSDDNSSHELFASAIEHAVLVVMFIAPIAYFFVRKTSYPFAISLLVGVGITFVVWRISWTTLELGKDGVKYDTIFKSEEIPLSDILKVGVSTSKGFLPSQNLVFMLRGQSGVKGRFIQIGYFDRQRADVWAAKVTQKAEALHSHRPSPGPRT